MTSTLYEKVMDRSVFSKLSRDSTQLGSWNDPVKAHANAFKESFGRILVLGCSYKGNSWFYLGVSYFSVIIGICLLSYTSYLVSHDLRQFCETLHFLILNVNGLCVSMWYLYNRQCFDNMFRTIGHGFFNYGATFDSKSFDNVVDQMRYSAKVRKQKFGGANIRLIYLTGVSFCVVKPLLEWLLGTNENVDMSDGIIRTLPLPIWFPFDVSSKTHYIAGAVYQYWNTIVVTLFLSCLEIPLITMSEELCSELQILARGLQLFDKRAEALYSIVHGTAEKGGGNRFDREKLDHCMQLCLRDSVQHHAILIRFFADLRRISFVALLSGVLSSTLLLCFVGVLFADKSVPLSAKLVFGMFIIAELVYTFIFCWYGQRIQNASQLASEAIYNSNWISHSRVVKPYMIVIRACTLRPLQLSAAGFVNVSLPTFNDIVSSAFSYFSLLQALNE